MLATTILVLALSAGQQAERCDPGDGQGEMICIDRNGWCVELSVDGHATSALKDEAVAKRVHAIKHSEDVCWKVDEPVSPTFRAKAVGGGLYPSFVGKIEKLQVNLYPLDDYDPEFDSRLDALNGTEMKADGDPNGTWQLTPERPLAPGEYVAVFRVFGVDNWDRQAVLLKVDGAAKPAPAGQ